jgi:uncharacterized protein YbjQ (UPF0145 family)
MKILNLIISFVLLITLLGCASGSHIITGKVRPAIKISEVKLYLKPPKKYEIIGIVEASSEVEFSSQAAQDRAIAELKLQAAKIGANGVLISDTGNKYGNISGFYSNGIYYTSSSEMKTAQGKAIFVIKE